MTATRTDPPRTLLTGAPAPIRWHRPLLAVAVLMVALAVFCLIARFVDPRTVTGLDVWDKPLKFAISTAIYSVTWAWLIGQLQRARRIAWVMGSVIGVALVIELVIITGLATLGETSHFNVSTPAHTTAWAIMAVSITALWLATFLVAALLFFSDLGDRARTVAIRSGAVISLAGLGLAYLMTGPTARQLDDFQGIAGAHTVGISDGGPGLPLLGWSTVAGDLRIPHFVGMHALQVIPLVLIAMELLARRVAVFGDVDVRARLVWVAAGTYTAVLGVLTWQALRGQSIVAPDAATLAATLLIGVVAVVLALVVLVRGASAHPPRPLASPPRPLASPRSIAVTETPPAPHRIDRGDSRRP